MKNIITSKAILFLSDKILLFLLLVFLTITPIMSYSQDIPAPIPLSGFTCHFTNLDGDSVKSCGSIIRATINYPVGSNLIQNVRLIFPNSFTIIGFNDANQITNPIPIPSSVYNGISLTAGQLVNCLFTPTGTSGTMTVLFRYMSCNNNNSATLNTTGLFFDCEGGPSGNESQYTADLNYPINPTSEPLIPTIIGGQLAQVIHSNLPPIRLFPITPNNNFTGNQGQTYQRRYIARIYSRAITHFDLSIALENDIIFGTDPLYIVYTSGVLTPISISNIWNPITLSSDYYTENAYSRTVTFAQNCTLTCPTAAPTSTNISAKLGCECIPNNPNNSFTTQLQLNGSISNDVPNITLGSIDLSPADANTTEFCTGNYNYDITFRNNGPIARLENLTIPLNTSSFQVTGVSIQSTLTPSTFTPISFTTDITDPLNSSFSINFLSVFSSGDPNWAPFFYDYALPNGPWLNLGQFTIRIHLSYQCSNTNNCQDPRIFLTPLNNNQAVFEMRNTCNAPILPNPTVNLNNIASPTIPPATVTGTGCVDLNAESNPLPPTNLTSVPFEYDITIPGQSPFQINNLSNGNNNLIDCENIQYRAILSITSPSSLNLGNSTITNVFLNYNTTPLSSYSIGNSEIAINLPNPTLPFTNYHLEFTLNGIECPAVGEATFGTISYKLTIQAVCLDCGTSSPCIRNLGCSLFNDNLLVHCPGDCDGVVGIDPGITIIRTTFGWLNQNEYPLGNPVNAAYINSLLISDSQKRRELRSFYPFDIFKLKATGSVSAYDVYTAGSTENHIRLGLHLNLSENLGNDFLQLISYSIKFTRPTDSTNSFTITNNTTNINAVFNFMPTNPIAMVDFPHSFELSWLESELSSVAGIDINDGSWDIEFEGDFRVDPTSSATTTPVDIMCQFVSYSNANNVLPSCDPYGTSIEMLIPNVTFSQNSEQTGSLNLDPNNVTVYNITENEACNFYHAIGVTHSGGRGNIPDFPFEYRPLSYFPQFVTSSEILDVFPFIGSNYTYSETFINSGSFKNDQISHLLPPFKREEILQNQFKGIVLKLEKDCPNTATNSSTNSPTVPFSLNSPYLGIDQFAYLHDGHLMNPLPHLPIEATHATIPEGLSCADIVSFQQPAGTINIPNGTSTVNFSLAVPSLAQGLPMAFKIVSNNNNVILSNFIFAGSTLTSANGWYSFSNGLSTAATPASIQIELLGVDGCFGEPFDLSFEWQIFCDESQLTAFMANGAPSCLGCSQTRTFQRGQSTIDDLEIQNNFSIVGCDLVWTLNLENPDNMPTITFNTLDLNFTTGMVFESCTTVVSGGGTQPSFLLPFFNLIEQQNPSYSYIQTNFHLANLIIPPGQSLTYTIVFSLSEEFCTFYPNGSSIINASLEGGNICNDGFEYTPIEIQNSAINPFIQLLESEGCCNANPPIAIHHVCNPTSLGSITITNPNNNPNFNPLQVTLYYPNNVLPPSFLTINSLTGEFAELDLGTYNLIIYNDLNGGYFVQQVIIEDYAISATLTANLTTVCQGSPVTLTANATPQNSPSNIPYVFTYIWTGLSNSQTTNVVTDNPTATGINSYSVDVSNGSCNSLASVDIDVLPNNLNISIEGDLQFCQNSNTVLSALALPSATSYLWSNGQTTQEINVSFAGTYSVTATDANGCTSQISAPVSENPLPTVPDFGTNYYYEDCPTNPIEVELPLNIDNDSYTYQWTSSSGAVITDPSQMPLITTEEGIYQLVATDINNCSSTSSDITVSHNPALCPCPCAIAGETTHIFSSYNNLVAALGNNIIGLCLKFTENITITSGLYLRDCIITVAPGKRIINNTSSPFVSSNCTFKGCEQMWDGIQNKGVVKFDNNIIKDARIGLEMWMGAITTLPQTSLNNTTFTNNYIGLAGKSGFGSNTHVLSLQNCSFQGGMLLPGFPFQIPTPASSPIEQGGYAGIRIIGSNMPVYINSSNSFYNLYNGIVSFKGNIRIDGAKFKNIQYDPDFLLYPNGPFNPFNANNYGNNILTPSAAVNAFYGNLAIIGLGTEPTSESMFYGCRKSIACHQTNLAVDNVKIDSDDNLPAETGIMVFKNQYTIGFKITNNRIRTNGVGIKLDENGGYNSELGVVANNNITVLDNFDLAAPPISPINPYLIKDGISVKSSLQSRGISIKSNTINLRSWHENNGIYINNSLYVNAYSNYIRRYSVSGGAGINIQNNQAANISCNHSIGMEPNVITARNQAYKLDNSTSTLKENYSNNTRAGFVFNSACATVKILHNQMGEHFFDLNSATQPIGALYIGETGSIGDHTDKFNKFSINSVALKHPNNSSLDYIYVSTQFLPTNSTSQPASLYYPEHYPFDPECDNDPFFRCLIAPSAALEPNHAPCGVNIGGSTIPGSMIANPSGATNVATSLANGTLQYNIYNEESKFELAKTIDRALKEQTLVLPDTGIYFNWKDSLAQSNSSKFNAVSYNWQKQDTSSLTIQLAEASKIAKDTAMNFAMYFLASLQGQENPDSTILADVYYNITTMQIHADSLDSLVYNINQSQNQVKRDSASYFNQNINNPADYEAMEKTINTIYLSTLAMDEFEFTPQQIQQIQNIAFQCPLKSSAAVYKARAMYSLIHPFINFDNYSICAGQGMSYRNGNTNQNYNNDLIILTQQNNLLQIELKTDIKFINYKILNCLGQTIKQWSSAGAENQKLQRIDVSSLNNGLYILQGQDIFGKVSNQKFIFNK